MNEMMMKEISHLVAIKEHPAGPMLRRSEDKSGLGMLKDAVLIPPAELHDVLTSRIIHPLAQTLWHKPAQLRAKAGIQSMNGRAVKVVVVVVANDYRINNW